MTGEVDMLTPCPACGMAYVEHSSLESLAGCMESLLGWDGDDGDDDWNDGVPVGQLTLAGLPARPSFGGWAFARTETVDGPTMRRVL